MQAMHPALEDIARRIQAAAAGGTALRIRGGGTKDFHGQAVSGEVLDTRQLAGITSYEPSELVVTVRAGTLLADLEALLAQEGQCLPFEPPHFAEGATAGGMVAAGLSGPARASAGSVRDYVLGAVMLNGKGEQLTFGGQVMKNVAGYDVSRLLAGSFGTLGLIAEVSLKVLPVAPAEATLRFEMSQGDALHALNQWGGQPLPLNASCWQEEAGRGVLHVRLRGAVAAVEAACRKMGGELQEPVAQHQPVIPDLIRDPSQRTNLSPDWQAIRNHSHSFFTPRPDQCLWRLSLPQTAPALDLPQPQLIEWHGGLRWLHAPAADAGKLRELATKMGGHATLFRAADEADRAAQVFTPLAAPLDRIHRELRKQFDPAGIFNPGRLYTGL